MKNPWPFYIIMFLVLLGCSNNENTLTNENDKVSTNNSPVKGEEIISGIYFGGSRSELVEQEKYYQNTILKWEGKEYEFEVSPECDGDIITGAIMSSCQANLGNNENVSLKIIAEIYSQKYRVLTSTDQVVLMREEYLSIIKAIDKIEPYSDALSLAGKPAEDFIFFTNSKGDMLIEASEHTNGDHPCIIINYSKLEKWVIEMNDNIKTQKWYYDQLVQKNQEKTVENIGDY